MLHTWHIWFCIYASLSLAYISSALLMSEDPTVTESSVFACHLYLHDSVKILCCGNQSALYLVAGPCSLSLSTPLSLDASCKHLFMRRPTWMLSGTLLPYIAPGREKTQWDNCHFCYFPSGQSLYWEPLHLFSINHGFINLSTRFHTLAAILLINLLQISASLPQRISFSLHS